MAVSTGLLLGAGFSYDFGMPLAVELTKIFLGIFTENKAKIFAERLSEKDPYSKDRPINREAIFRGMNFLLEYKNNEKNNNYEEFLSKLLELERKPNRIQSDIDTYEFLYSVFYEIIHQILNQFQKKSYTKLYHENLKWFSNIRNILSEKETWILTLNHDVYMECLATDLKIPITYGDPGKISFPIDNINIKTTIDFTCTDRDNISMTNSGFFKDIFGINLVKIHGGLSELGYKDKKVICNQSLLKNSSWQILQDFERIDKMAYYHNGKKLPSSGVDRWISNLNGNLDIICRSMLTGGKKYSSTINEKKGEEKLKLLSDILESLDELTIIGYGFGDFHINTRIYKAMILNSKLKLQIVDPTHKPIPDFLRPFDYDSRIKKAICGAAHWIDYSISRKWNYEQVDALKKNEVFRQEIIQEVESLFFQ